MNCLTRFSVIHPKTTGINCKRALWRRSRGYSPARDGFFPSPWTLRETTDHLEGWHGVAYVNTELFSRVRSLRYFTRWSGVIPDWDPSSTICDFFCGENCGGIRQLPVTFETWFRFTPQSTRSLGRPPVTDCWKKPRVYTTLSILRRCAIAVEIWNRDWDI